MDVKVAAVAACRGASPSPTSSSPVPYVRVVLLLPHSPLIRHLSVLYVLGTQQP